MPKLSVIIPVYNEAQTLQALVDKVRSVRVPLDAHDPDGPALEQEIILVDDASTDGTDQVIAQLGFPGLIKLRHEKNRGKGAAIRTAIAAVSGDYAIIQDADLEYSPDDYPAMLRPLLEKHADVVYGSRFLGPHRAFNFTHMLGNKFLTLLTNILYNTILTDMETCYKAFRSDVLKSLPLRSDRFNIEPEITAKVLKRRCRVVEVPISYFGRDFSEGKKITWRDGFPAVWALLRYRFMD